MPGLQLCLHFGILILNCALPFTVRLIYNANSLFILFFYVYFCAHAHLTELRYSYTICSFLSVKCALPIKVAIWRLYYRVLKGWGFFCAMLKNKMSA